MRTVFLSYRRDETAGEAMALARSLGPMLGEKGLTFDVDSIELGRDFREVLKQRLASCDLMLVLIGRNWINARDETERQRRLDNPNDTVRLEIATALSRNIPVVPVLVQGARMPTPEQLPEDIRDLSFRNGFDLGHTRWDSDVREMSRRLRLDSSQPKSKEIEATLDLPPWLKRDAFWVVACLACLIGGAAAGLYLGVFAGHIAVLGFEFELPNRSSDELAQIKANLAMSEKAYKLATDDNTKLIVELRDRSAMLTIAEQERDHLKVQVADALDRLDSSASKLEQTTLKNKQLEEDIAQLRQQNQDRSELASRLLNAEKERDQLKAQVAELLTASMLSQDPDPCTRKSGNTPVRKVVTMESDTVWQFPGFKLGLRVGALNSMTVTFVSSRSDFGYRSFGLSEEVGIPGDHDSRYIVRVVDISRASASVELRCANYK